MQSAGVQQTEPQGWAAAWLLQAGRCPALLSSRTWLHVPALSQPRLTISGLGGAQLAPDARRGPVWGGVGACKGRAWLQPPPQRHLGQRERPRSQIIP